MSDKQWYYVEGGERCGPTSEGELLEMIRSGDLVQDSYVWTKGMDNWQKIFELPELMDEIGGEEDLWGEEETPDLELEAEKFNIEKLTDRQEDDGAWFIKTGQDRGGHERQYGPFNLETLKKLKKQKRISAETFIYSQGMKNWKSLGEFSDYEFVFSEVPPVIDALEKRKHQRKPFVARMFISDDQKLFEGICRDISLGGMQVLVAGYPGREGDEISFNVHPENSKHHFVASGKVVRLLEEGQGFSFEFNDLSDEAKDAIRSYLDD